MFKKKLKVNFYGKSYKVSDKLYFEIDRMKSELKQKDYIIRRLREKLGEIEEHPLTTPIYKTNKES
jgi:hypothetical protein